MACLCLAMNIVALNISPLDPCYTSQILNICISGLPRDINNGLEDRVFVSSLPSANFPFYGVLFALV